MHTDKNAIGHQDLLDAINGHRLDLLEGDIMYYDYEWICDEAVKRNRRLCQAFEDRIPRVLTCSQADDLMVEFGNELVHKNLPPSECTGRIAECLEVASEWIANHLFYRLEQYYLTFGKLNKLNQLNDYCEHYTIPKRLVHSLDLYVGNNAGQRILQEMVVKERDGSSNTINVVYI